MINGENGIMAEQSLIGSILIDPSTLERVAGMVAREEFALPLHGELFDLLLKMRGRREQIDPVTVTNRAAQEEIGFSKQYCMELMDITPTAANAEAYAKIIRENARLRALSQLAENIQSAVEKGAKPDKIAASITRAVEEADRRAAQSGVYTPREAMVAFWNHLETRMNGNSQVVSSGYSDLDRVLGGGFLNSGLYFIAARPGMGKTSLGLNIADKVAEGLGPVLFVTLEMDVEQLQAKRIARCSYMDSAKVLMGQDFSAEELGAMAMAGEKLENVPLEISKAPSQTVEEINALARRVKGLKMIVVDYFGKIDVPPRLDRVAAYTAVSGQLKTMARRYKVPVLALAQLNREVEKRTNKRPVLSDLRETGAAEQDADAIIFLYREDYYATARDKPTGPVLLEAEVAKNRHGGPGSCTLAFNMPLCKITGYRPGAGEGIPAGKGAAELGFRPLPDRTKTPFDGDARPEGGEEQLRIGGGEA